MIKTFIRVENLGPIKHGEIEIRPLTVIIGRNNTGKSYMAMTYYALFNALKKAMSPLLLDLLLSSRVSKSSARRYLEEIEKEMLDLGMDDLSADQLDNIVRIVGKVVEEINSSMLSRYKSKLNDIVKTEIERTFAANIEDLRRDHRYKLTIDFKIMHDHAYIGVLFEADQNNTSTNIYYSLDEKYISKRILRRIKNVSNNENGKNTKKLIVDTILEQLVKILMHINGQEIYFMPASRAGILHSYRTIAASIISSAPLTAVRGANIPRLPGVLADFLNLLINTEPVSQHREDVREYLGLSSFFKDLFSEFYKIVEFIEESRRIDKKALEEIIKVLEKEIFEGEINLRRTTRIHPPEPIYRTDGLEVNIANVSSMIAELSPLDIFIKYNIISENDILIIEEPEAHLHPDKQVKVAELLAMLVNLAKINVLITTHSDIILSKLSNLVKMGYLLGSGNDNVDRNIAIKRNKIAVYHFTKKDDGVIVKKIRISREGIADKVFYEIIKDLYEESMDLYFKVIGESIKEKK